MLIAGKIKTNFVSFLYFVRYNFFILFLIGFFTYRTFFVGRLNYALLVFLISLLVIIICRFIYKYSVKSIIGFFYRILVLVGISLLISAVIIQTIRFAYTFATTFTEPTLAKILVRIGIVTLNFYIFTLIFAFIYYLYAHEMLSIILDGSIKRLRRNSSYKPTFNNWRQERLSSLIFIYTFFWGGFATVFTLGVGFIAWLLR